MSWGSGNGGEPHEVIHAGDLPLPEHHPVIPEVQGIGVEPLTWFTVRGQDEDFTIAICLPEFLPAVVDRLEKLPDTPE